MKNIFASGELVKESVTEKISATAYEGKTYMENRFGNGSNPFLALQT